MRHESGRAESVPQYSGRAGPEERRKGGKLVPKRWDERHEASDVRIERGTGPHLWGRKPIQLPETARTRVRPARAALAPRATAVGREPTATPVAGVADGQRRHKKRNGGEGENSPP